MAIPILSAEHTGGRAGGQPELPRGPLLPPCAGEELNWPLYAAAAGRASRGRQVTRTKGLARRQSPEPT